MPATGHIELRLGLAGGVIDRVDIRSTRRVQASRLLEGKTVAKALDLLPLLFSVCGAAQRCAGLAAVEQALGITAGPDAIAARRRLLLVETVVEHATRILMDWPALIGEPPRIEAVRRLRAAMVREAEPADTEAAVAAVADRLFQILSTEGLAGFGAADIPLMPPLTPADADALAARLAGDHDGAFVAQPDWNGRVLETGPLARQCAQPKVVALRTESGNGLAARFAARLVELSAALESLAQAGSTGPVVTPALAGGSGVGLGVVEAARGLLAHRVEVVDGVIRRYQILAPTEWNFHPDGPLARGLRGQAMADGPALPRLARMLVCALDPCVACEILVE